MSYRPSSTGRKSSGKFKAKSVLKDVYLVNHNISVMPRGVEKAEMHNKKQVITAFRIYAQLSETELREKLETLFSNVLDMSKPSPRYEIILYV